MTAQSDDEAAPPAVPVTFVGSPHAPDVFADEAVGFFVRSGVISITFASSRVDHSKTPAPSQGPSSVDWSSQLMERRDWPSDSMISS